MTSDDDSPLDYIQQMLTGGVVNTSALASKLAGALIAGHYGDKELELQLPLTIADQGDCWLVEGSRNKDRALEGTGHAIVKIKKSNGAILQFMIRAVMHVDPRAQAIVDAQPKVKDRNQR